MTEKEVAIEDDQTDIEPSKETELAKPEDRKAESTEEETEGLAEAKAPEAPEAAEEEEEIEIVEEKFYDLNLRRIWTAPREKRTPRAVRYVRQYAAQRMKTDNVSLSEETNSLLWNRGISKPPRKIRIRVVKDKEGKVIVFPGEGK
jgi:ribosomal protein L31E